MPNELEQQVEQEVEQVEEVPQEEAQPEVNLEEKLAELEKKLATTVAQKEHWREEAAKAKKAPAPTPTMNLSPGDMLAVQQAKITEADDMDRVAWFADSNGISLREALVHPEMKAILALREEQRRVAVATNVESVRRGSVKINDETLLQNASMGKIPTADDEIEALVSAKFKRK